MPVRAQQNDICKPMGDPGKLPECSYKGVNSSCYVRIDRLVGGQPPTIFEKPGGKVLVVVDHASPFETLTLDLKSSAVVLPTDQFQAFNSALGDSLKKLVFVQLNDFEIADLRAQKFLIQVEQIPPAVKAIEDKQDKQLGDLYRVFDDARLGLKPPPSNFCTDKSVEGPWRDTNGWTSSLMQRMEIKAGELQQADQELIANLPPILKEKYGPQLQERQKRIDGIINSLTIKLGHLSVALKDVTTTSSKLPPLEISDPRLEPSRPKDPNYLTQTWILNYANKLEPVGKKVYSAEDWKDTPLADMAAEPTKQQITPIIVQFQSEARWEFTTGLVVPLRPLHSYGKAAVASNGQITDNVVQDTKTYAVVPMALANVRIASHTTARCRFGLFGSFGLGYNPTSSAVEFGVGPSLAWGSLEINFLADIGRDAKLTGGFKVGQSLGLSSPPIPPSEVHWKVVPAIGVSIRIPLGGSSSSGK
jgi:hypothetical protein